MSQVLKNSMSLVAVMASALSIAACSKNEASKTESGAADTVVSAETQAAIADSQCPTIIGTYVDAAGEKVKYTMMSVSGGVSVISEDGERIVDGQSHTHPSNPAAVYTASCKAGVLTAVTKTTLAGKTSTEVVKMSVSEETGDMTAEIETDGVGQTVVYKKAAREVPEPKEFELEHTALDTTVNVGDIEVNAAPEQAPATEAAPATTTAPAVESAPVASPATELERADLRPMPSGSASSKMPHTKLSENLQ